MKDITTFVDDEGILVCQDCKTLITAYCSHCDGSYLSVDTWLPILDCPLGLPVLIKYSGGAMVAARKACKSERFIFEPLGYDEVFINTEETRFPTHYQILQDDK